jgi:predicted RecA/RadA family phage recombinase
MQNFRKDGKTIKWTNATGATVNPGDPVIVGGKVFVSNEKILNTATGILMTSGVYEWPKTNPLVISQGDKVFWDGTKITKTVTDTFVGTCHEPAASTAGTVLVDIEPGTAGTQMAHVAPIATVDGSDAATTQALANATKVKVNALIAALIASGQMAGD